jgi:hypothetical protein
MNDYLTSLLIYCLLQALHLFRIVLKTLEQTRARLLYGAQNSQKVNVPVHLLCKPTVERTCENIRLRVLHHGLAASALPVTPLLQRRLALNACRVSVWFLLRWQVVQ